MLSIGDVLFDAGARRLFRGGKELRLSLKAAAVLSALAEQPARVWPRNALLDRVWPSVVVGEEVLTQTIAELRRAFGDDARSPRYLLTVHKTGYRLIPPVRDAAADEAVADSAGSPLTASDYSAYLVAAELCERGGAQNLEAAIGRFSALVGRHPGFAPANAGLARSLIFLATYYRPGHGMRETALEHCAIAQRLSATSPEAYATEGFIYAMMNDRHRSGAGFGRALNLAPRDGETHYLLGLAGVIQGDMRSAALIFEQAARLKAGDHRSLLIAGKLRLALGEQDSATRDFAAAMPSLEARPSWTRRMCAPCAVRRAAFGMSAGPMRPIN